jgi:hypothetical protein
MSDHTVPSAPAELHVCRSCGSPLVYLVDGVECAPGLWDLTLRCPECHDVREVCCPEPGLARLEGQLCRGVAEVERELARFARECFEQDMEPFLRALHAGAILPMDFGVPR